MISSLRARRALRAGVAATLLMGLGVAVTAAAPAQAKGKPSANSCPAGGVSVTASSTVTVPVVGGGTASIAVSISGGQFSLTSATPSTILLRDASWCVVSSTRAVAPGTGLTGTAPGSTARKAATVKSLALYNVRISASSPYTTDQSNLFADNTSLSGLYCAEIGVLAWAQTFTAGTTGQMAGIALATGQESPASPLTVDLQSVGLDGLPTGTVLATAELEASGPSDPAVQLQALFAAPASITAGTKYAIVPSSDCAGGPVWSKLASDDAYAGGELLANDGSGWSVPLGVSGSSYDLFFTTLMS